MQKKDQGNFEDDDLLWESFTSHIIPLKSVRYAGATDKIVGGRQRHLPRKAVSGAPTWEAAKNPVKPGLVVINSPGSILHLTKRGGNRGNPVIWQA